MCQLKQLKTIMEIDLWKRLPLPNNYEYFNRNFRLPEFKSFMSEYPFDIKSLLKGILDENDCSPDKPRQILSQFSVNPFSTQYRVITTQTHDQVKGQGLDSCRTEDFDENLNEMEPGESGIILNSSVELSHKTFRLKNHPQRSIATF